MFVILISMQSGTTTNRWCAVCRNQQCDKVNHNVGLSQPISADRERQEELHREATANTLPSLRTSDAAAVRW